MMKYLVNRETKEHYRFGSITVPYGPVYEVVEADDEGWIKWEGGECPVRSFRHVEFRCINDSYESVAEAGNLRWERIGLSSDIGSYRPILPETSKPEPENAWPDDGMPASVYIDVFGRFNAAVAASESIPGLIAEINAMLPDGYEVREKAKIEAVADDMSDWRNWKEWDLVQCVREYEGQFSAGSLYAVFGVDEGGTISVYKDDEGELNGIDWFHFKFHSRPVTK